MDAIESLPRRLRISTLDELKSKLLGVVVVALAVRFELAYEFSNEGNLPVLGGAIGVVVVSLAAFTFARSSEHAAGELERAGHRQKGG